MTTVNPPPGSPGPLDKLLASARQLHQAGQFAEAAGAYQELLSLRPDVPELQNEMGSLLARLRKFGEAQTHYERALTLRPDFVPACHNLGNLLRMQGRLEEALPRYEQVALLIPDSPDAHNNVGNVLAMMSRYDEATRSYERALVLRPPFAEAHHNLANVLKQQGQIERAVQHYQQVLALEPAYADAHLGLAMARRQQNRLDEAEVHYRQALALKPGSAQTHNGLGMVLWRQGRSDDTPAAGSVRDNLAAARQEQGRLDEAVTHFRQALSIDPACAAAHFNLAVALLEQGRLDEASSHLQTVIALDPGSVQAHFHLANVLRDQGRLDQALAHYDRALALDPRLGEAHFDRALLRTFRPGDADLAALERLAADPVSIPAGAMPAIHFALGKALEDLGDSDRAFQHWLQGNALRRRQIDYDPARDEALFQRMAHIFDAALFERLAGVGDPSPAPIFVLGMPRSGSTLVEQILASHPLVFGAGELRTLERLVHQGGGVEALATLEAEACRRLGQQYLAGLRSLPTGKTRISDKMPGNFLYVGLIHLILPRAKIIHTMRDPVDTCLSCFSRLLSVGHHFSYDLIELGRYYRHYHRLMDHWRSVLPAGAMLDVVYENVVDDLEGQSRRMLDYLGLPWDERCLSFHKTVRPVVTASSVQVRRPLNRSGMARWRQYEAYLGPLLTELAGCRPAP